MLIAARGVAAVRIIRACHDLGLAAVAVYDDADIWAPHAGLADEAYALPAGSGYDDAAALIAVAVRSGADAVHPGDRPLADDPAAAAAVRHRDLVWVGAPEAALVYPRQDRALAAPAPGRAQVDFLASASGHLVLGTRVTVLTRRGVPVAACTAPPEVAAELAPRARAAADQLGFRGYGVARFERTKASEWTNAGVSPRLTDVSAVVEEQSGADIARAQLALAFDPGAPLPAVRRDWWAFGVAVEAEDRGRGALRAAGVVRSFQLPAGPGIRVDPGLREGQVVVPSRDNRLAFVTVSARTQAQARARLRRAAGEISVRGVTAAVWLPGETAAADPAFTDVAPEPGVTALEVRGGSRIRTAFRAATWPAWPEGVPEHD